MNRTSRCPVCGSDRTFLFLNRSNVPVHQNLVIKDQVAAVNIPRGDLRFVCCEECGFVFNSAFDPSKLSYGAAYDKGHGNK
jgi:predicted Zn-ribbon and HTH transcriptional regulator